MAYVAMAPCFACKRVFSFNPHLVPSTPPDVASERYPVCEACMRDINARRVKAGRPPHPIMAGAYDVQGEETDTDARR